MATQARWPVSTAALAAAALLAACQQRPQETVRAPTPELIGYVGQAEYQANALRAAQGAGVWLASPCPTARFTPSTVVAVLSPVAFSAPGRPVGGGMWQERVTAEGCGKTILLNTAVIVRAPGRMDVAPMLPGDTHADAVLQEDGYKTVRTLFGAPAPGCAGKTYFSETAYLGQEDAGAVGTGGRLPWKEQWSIVSCGRQTTYTMHFVPGAKGNTSIRINPAETVAG